jgi:N-acetylneuraminic acid mutarotase
MFLKTSAAFVFIAFAFALPSMSFAQEVQWTTKANMPTARCWFSTSVVNGKIYAIGGWSGPLSAVEEYDPATNTWTRKAGLPVGRAYLTTCVVDGKIYAIGGSDSAGRRSRVEQYDPVTDRWTTRADLLIGRNQLASSVVNGKIYAIGGYPSDGTSPAIVEEYDPASDSWVRKADMPTPRNALSACAVNGRIYAIGGAIWDPVTGTTTLSAMEEYDPATDTWTTKADLPMPTFNAATAVVNGKIYAIGGRGALTQTPGADLTTLSSIMKYDPATDTWTKEGDLRVPRTALSASAVDGTIYVVGGFEVLVRPISTVEAYRAVPWSFAHAPNPSDGALHPSAEVNLSWSPGDFAVLHDVYLGDSFDAVNEGLGETFRGRQVLTFLTAGIPGSPYPDGLVPGTTYYWRVDQINDAEPNSPWKGPVWSFTIQPRIANHPNPPDGAEFVDVGVELSWMAGVNAAWHAVYFGDNFDDVNNATGAVKQLATTDRPGPLEYGKSYYWRVDEHGGRGGGMYKGDVWTFTTEAISVQKGPYLIYPGDNTQMMVLWQLNGPEPYTLRWGHSDGSVTPEMFGDFQYEHVMTGLTPGSRYYYEMEGVGSGSFLAAPPDDAANVNFLAYGDTRSNPQTHDAVNAQMIAAYTADSAYQTFTMLAGDWVGRGDSELAWTDEFFNRSQENTIEMQANLPINGCIGNHEQTGAIFQKYWPYPYESDGWYWSFDYGPVHIVIVDHKNEGDSLGTAQKAWLEADLAGSSKEWNFLQFHAPVYSAGGHPNNTVEQGYIQSLCETYGVAIVFAGHNHYYARAVVNGVVHITTGGGGAPLGTPATRQPNIVAYDQSNHFCKIDIEGRQLTFEAISLGGTIIDAFTMSH